MADFNQYLLTVYSHATLSISIALGLRLELFDALGKFSAENPATADVLAEQLGLKPRYVFELLSGLACGDIIESDSTGKSFWIKHDRLEVVTGSKEPVFAINALAPVLGQNFESVLNAFKKGEPEIDFHATHQHSSHEHHHGDYAHSHKSHHHDKKEDKVHHHHDHNHSKYGHFNPGSPMFEVSKHAAFKKHLNDYIQKLGVKPQLEQGIDVLDVGCGHGFQLLEFARLFPNSRFVGFDLSETVIEQANKKKSENNLENVEFLSLDAKKLEDSWAGKFDLAISFDSFHHHEHPDTAIKEVYCVLKPGGLFALTEMKGTADNAYIEKTNNRALAIASYTFGLYHRKPEEDPNKATVGMFASWGVEHVKKMLTEIGFNNVKAEETKLSEFNVLYVARK